MNDDGALLLCDGFEFIIFCGLPFVCRAKTDGIRFTVHRRHRADIFVLVPVHVPYVYTPVYGMDTGSLYAAS